MTTRNRCPAVPGRLEGVVRAPRPGLGVTDGKVPRDAGHRLSHLLARDDAVAVRVQGLRFGDESSLKNASSSFDFFFKAEDRILFQRQCGLMVKDIIRLFLARRRSTPMY